MAGANQLDVWTDKVRALGSEIGRLGAEASALATSVQRVVVDSGRQPSNDAGVAGLSAAAEFLTSLAGALSSDSQALAEVATTYETVDQALETRFRQILGELS